MTPEEAVAFFDSVTYKPGSEIRLSCRPHHQGRMGMGGIFELFISILVPNVESPDAEMIPVGESHMISEEELHHSDRYHLTHVLERRIRKLEDHESSEWLKIDGKRVTEPHPERVKS